MSQIDFITNDMDGGFSFGSFIALKGLVFYILGCCSAFYSYCLAGKDVTCSLHRVSFSELS